MARRRRVKPARAVSPVPFVGMGLMAMTLFCYAYAVVIVPWYVLAALLVVWVVLMVRCVGWWSTHPNRLIWTPLAALVLWLVVLVGGAYAFDWQPTWDPGTAGKVPDPATKG